MPSPAAPGAIPLLERLVDARDPHRADLGDRRRPHRLDDHLARRHQVHRLVEGLPEGPELTRLLRLGEDRHRLVDLLLGHVALVAVLDLAHRLADHRRVHDADGGDVQDRRLAPELGVEQLRPALDGAVDEVGPDAQGVGVVDGRHHRVPVRHPRRELLVARVLDEADRVRRGALRDLRGRGQPAVLEDPDNLVEVLDPPRCPWAACCPRPTPSSA